MSGSGFGEEHGHVARGTAWQDELGRYASLRYGEGFQHRGAG
ncbi:Hypothetical protein AA314_05187 [Archangium gephyra]|uniref:Uncharacterized protein n=1 Tax=Archangium gephyra TaxID=48 RepID=A0AAC8QAM2_9BACT|nr:Hypothetical protein AA314_05187 [Archangium gephyra]